MGVKDRAIVKSLILTIWSKKEQLEAVIARWIEVTS